MALMLFDDCARNYGEPCRHGEHGFVYLNRSPRKECAGVRSSLEQWFSRYPAGKQAQLRARFRDVNSDKNHLSAFHELLLHELLLCLGCRVTVEPSPAAAATKLPDFLVESASSEAFYMEAVVATDVSLAEDKAAARRNEFYESVNKLKSPNFFVNIEAYNWHPEKPVPGWVQTKLSKWLESLDVEVEYERMLLDSGATLPRYALELEGREIIFEACPKEPEDRGDSGLRNIAWYPGAGGRVEPERAIKKAVREKGGRYGRLDRPYVIAVDCVGMFADFRDVEKALYGDARWNKAAALAARAITKDGDSVWTGSRGATYTRVSGVLAMRVRDPLQVASSELHYYVNPWAGAPCVSGLTSLPTASLGEEGIVYRPGLTLASLLDLPPDRSHALGE